MTMRRLLASPVAVLAALTVLAEAAPCLASRVPQARAAAPAPDRPAIRSVKVRPRSPVAGPRGAVRLVVEVVARGAAGRDGVTLRVEPAGHRRRARGGHKAARRHPAPGRRGGRERHRRVPDDGYGRGGGRGPEGTAVPPVAVVPVAVQARPAPAWEVWRFDPPVGLTRWYPSGRWRVVATARDAGGATATASATFLLRKATRFSGVRVTRTRKRPRRFVRVSGMLLRVDPAGRFDYWSFPGQRVTVQFRERGARNWKSVARTGTDRDGYFHRRVRRARGVWRVVYRGTRYYAGSATSGRHISRY
ncbi:hypothetical protein [Sphaerisporangium fuscum]|uniref:hypothetical protein n=1 Tax=Sphaerisporangium fuscum TaxID=2835868 RepID=UPI001BDC754A|nr:hypothetical protein [Sphaerisporangium fuscum]